MDALLLLIAVAAIVTCLAAAIDAYRQPTDAWKRAGKSRGAWIALPLVFSLGLIGFVLAIVYFISIRPAVRDAINAPDLGGTTGVTF